LTQVFVPIGEAIVDLVGQRGSRTASRCAVTGHLSVHRPSQPTEVVGVGVSFTAGLIDGLGHADLLGRPHREALAAVNEPTLARVLDRAGLVAAITAPAPGADPPTRAELDADDRAGLMTGQG